MNNFGLPAYNKDNCKFFALGRNAMYAACKILDIKEKDEVLTPAFDCDGALQPFAALGCSLRFFRSNPYTFEADLENLKSMITPVTRLIHIVNHFGIPQPWDKLLELRKLTGIPILEDNAYSLFSRFKGTWLGEFGDVSIFSFRKNLPITSGGMLKINNQALKFDLPNAKTEFIYPDEIIRSLSLLKRQLLGLRRVPIGLKKMLGTKNSIVPLPPLYSESEAPPALIDRDLIGKEFSCDYLRPMSRIAFSQLRKFSVYDFQNIINKKRMFYSWLCDQLRNIRGIQILLPEIPDEIVPFSVFILIDSKRDIFYKELSTRFEVLAWPTLPGEVLKQLQDFPEVKLLGKKLLQLNLSADMVRRLGYRSYLKNLVSRIRVLAQQYLQ